MLPFFQLSDALCGSGANIGIAKFACRGDAEADGFAIEGVARIQPGGKGTVRTDREFGKAQAAGECGNIQQAFVPVTAVIQAVE